MDTMQEMWRSRYEESQMFTAAGLAAAKRNGKWGFVNRNGKEVCPCKYDLVFPFLGTEALVKIGSLWGAINTH